MRNHHRLQVKMTLENVSAHLMGTTGREEEAMTDAKAKIAGENAPRDTDEKKDDRTHRSLVHHMWMKKLQMMADVTMDVTESWNPETLSLLMRLLVTLLEVH